MNARSVLALRCTHETLGQFKSAGAFCEIGDDQRRQHAERRAGQAVQHLDDDEQRRVLGQGRRGQGVAVTVRGGYSAVSRASCTGWARRSAGMPSSL